MVVSGVGFFLAGSSESSSLWLVMRGNSSAAMRAQPFRVPSWGGATTARKANLVAAMPSEQASQDKSITTAAPVAVTFALYDQASTEGQSTRSARSRVVGADAVRARRS